MSSFPAPAPSPAPSEAHPRRLTSAVQVLIAINIAVLFVQTTALSELSQWLGFEVSALPGHWWTAFTYMFVHASAWHLLANMYALYVFGPRLEAHWGSRRLAWFYLLCGLGGAVFQMLFIRGGGLIGSSAAVFGVMTAYTMQWPDDEVYFMFVLPMRARTLIAGLFAFNLVLGVAATGDNGGTNMAYVAHLGGIIAAYIYMRMSATNGIDLGRQRVAELPDSDEPPRAIPRNLPRRERGDEVDDIVAKSKAIVAKRSAVVTPAPRRGEARADEINRVLDKISEQGIDSLTSEERKVLEDASKRLRDA